MNMSTRKHDTISRILFASGVNKETTKGRNENLTPGPGAYETNVSSITNKELTRKKTLIEQMTEEGKLIEGD